MTRLVRPNSMAGYVYDARVHLCRSSGDVNLSVPVLQALAIYANPSPCVERSS